MGIISEPKYDGDLTTKQYVDGLLDDANEDITARNQNFGSQPIPPYYVNDTYMNGTDIYICNTQRLIGIFNSSDWGKASGYTDDTLAGTKNKVFSTTPTVPYTKGDLWTGGPNGELRRCTVSRTSGSYLSTEWENATTYDSTSTVVEGGLVTTGTLEVVQGGTVAAGITGNASGDTAVRFWAGSSLANRNSAPFRVTQAGAVTASKIEITNGVMKIGTKEIFNSNGVLTNLQYQSASGNTPLGWYNDGSYHKMAIDIAYTIPSSFTIVQAYITIYHIPCYTGYTDQYGTTYYWGYSREIKPYKMNQTNFYLTKQGALGIPFYGDITSVTEIAGLGTSGWTAAVANSTTHNPETKISLDMASSFSSGESGIIILKTKGSTPSSAIDAYAKTAQAYATLNVIGYLKI